MLKKSKNYNPNYLAKIFEVKNIRKHSNADRLQIVTIDFQDVITGLDTKVGDIMIYFPIESQINEDFLSFTNSFRDSSLNKDKDKKGFFEKNRRVRAVKLRGEKSMGYIVPIQQLLEWKGLNMSDFKEEWLNEEFDMFGGDLLVNKYVVKTKTKNHSQKQGQTKKLTRLIEGQVHLHVSTENLRKNIHKLNPEDIISITYKQHGTSFWVSNVLVKKQLKWYEKFLQKLGVEIVDKEYDIVYGSRKVVKNRHFEDPKNQNHFYKYDLWKETADEVKEHIPKGFTLYGEIVGYTKQNSYIQGPYDYGCKVGEHKNIIYRITFTNEDGLVTELTYPQIAEFCEKAGLTPSYLFYYGKVKDLYPDIEYYNEGWREEYMERLIKDYTEKDCFMCENKVPEEGVVIRPEKLFSAEPFKLKSFRFLEFETKQLDKGVSDLESEN